MFSLGKIGLNALSQHRIMDFMRDFTISGDHLKEKTSKTKLNEMNDNYYAER